MSKAATPRSSNLGLRLIILGSMLLAVLCYVACGANAPNLQVQAPGELCAQALAMSSEVQAQAVKVGLEPIDLARRTCDAAILATKLIEANLPHLEGTAGAASSPSMALAGAAGAGP